MKSPFPSLVPEETHISISWLFVDGERRHGDGPRREH